jgi:ferrous iron transport protein B
VSAATATIALVGNPNCGKTTLFNGLTGRRQHVGNWPGVTVERKEGTVDLGGEDVTIVDLPGIYALLATSEDERVARDYILSGEPGLIVDIVDATNLERNLFLTTQLLDMGVPLVVLVNMMDMAGAQAIAIDVGELSARLGCPVVPIAATRKGDLRRALTALEAAWRARRQPGTAVAQQAAIEAVASQWGDELRGVAGRLGTNSRWLALKLLERDGWATGNVVESGALSRQQIEDVVGGLEAELGEPADIALAEARYLFIESVAGASMRRPPARETRSDRVDRIVLNRFLGIPIFLGAMFLLFWFTTSVGGAFIDFFDIAAATVFVDGFGRLLEMVAAPDWLVAVLAGGVGAGIQTVATFIPIVFAMFLSLSLLEDSGYMARAAFVMDRFMRWVGLPGKSFVPMLVGFGCNVPAIMATRTLESKRDRCLTVFMNPFMSCGARLPVYALVGAAFFGAAPGAVTLSLYLVGHVLAILTGLLLKTTLFKGEPTYFIMELPPYHAPRAASIVKHSGRRTLVFMTRARYIIPIVAVLALLNTVGVDGTLGNEDTPRSLLSNIGKAITPALEPMGVESENWPATVGIFTGIFAKEAVVGTLNSLYSQDAARQEPESAFSRWGGVGEALTTVPANLATVPASLADPLGLALVGEGGDTVADEVGATAAVYAGLRSGFSEGGRQAYAYLLFVLIYMPCVAAFAAMTKEIGARYARLSATYLTVLAWGRCDAVLPTRSRPQLGLDCRGDGVRGTDGSRLHGHGETESRHGGCVVEAARRLDRRGLRWEVERCLSISSGRCSTIASEPCPSWPWNSALT